MYLNRFIFPAPPCSYTEELIKENLIWVERPKHLPKGSKVTDRRREEPKEGLQIDKKDQLYFKGSLEELETGGKVINPNPDSQSQKDIFAYVPTKTSNTLAKLRTTNTIELEKPASEEQVSPRMSLEEIEIKVMDDEPERTEKKQQKCRGCFGFLRRSKAKTPTPPKKTYSWSTRNSTLSTRTSNVSVKTVFEEGSEEFKERSYSAPKATKHPKSTKTVKIPCLYLPCKMITKTTLLFFHSNGEDLYLTYELLKYISDYLLVNVFAVEYPGYGIYKGTASEKNVLLDAEAAYNYLLNHLHCKEEDIIIAGRSLGSGPATWLASFTNPGLLVLISPFTSIKGVVKHAFGSTACKLVKERFNNLKRIPSVNCPVFILHGKNDQLIPLEQANQLYAVVKGPKAISIAEEMDHASFDFLNDLIEPLKKFMADLKGPRLVTRRSRVLPSRIFRDIPVIEIDDLK